MSIGENWFAPHPTANIANAIGIQARLVRCTACSAVTIMTLRLSRIPSNPHLTVLRIGCPSWTLMPTMDSDADLASVASLIADRHRAQMMLTLLGGTPQSGSALAEAIGISRSLASAHLKKLVAGGFLRAESNGRQRLYSIAAEPVADAIEILLLLAPAAKVRS